MPTTFSPMVSMIPEMAAPMAKPSQWRRATSVEPKPGTTTGKPSLIPPSCPSVADTSTFGNYGLIRISRDTVRTHGRSHDGQMRKVHRVVLLRCRGHASVWLRIEHLRTPQRRLCDFAIPGAVVLAHNTQSALRVYIFSQAGACSCRPCPVSTA